MVIPAVDERMAVLEMRELPGRLSMRDCALVLGSGCWVGTFDWYRARAGEVSLAAAEGRAARAAPAEKKVSQLGDCVRGVSELPARVFVNRMDILMSGD